MFEPPDEFADAVAAASRRKEVVAEVNRVYDLLARLVERRKPICRTSGECCRFEAYGHRLFVTTAGLAAFAAGAGGSGNPTRTCVPPVPADPPDRLDPTVAPKPTGASEPSGALVRSAPPEPTGASELIESVSKTSGGDARTPLPETVGWDGTGCPFQVGGLCGVHAIRPLGCRVFFCDTSSVRWQERVYERLHARIRAIHDQFGVPYHYVEWRAGLRAVGLAGGPDQAVRGVRLRVVRPEPGSTTPPEGCGGS